MILGIGNDIVEIKRIEKSISKNKRFLDFCFSEKEKQAFLNSRMAPSKFASCFAAKEAFGKALGTGVKGFNFTDISVLREQSGKPYFEFFGKAKQIVESLDVVVHLALSNTELLTIAYVIIEKKERSNGTENIRHSL